MTLIIAAICKNGVFIRSDKRRMVMNKSGSIERYDDMNKVFISPDKRTIIYNHGINIINGKSWCAFAIQSENEIRLGGAIDINAALKIVEDVVSADVLIELSTNQLSDLCAFVIILKASRNKWSAGEICWKRGQGVKKILHGRFIRSGLGEQYLRLSNRQGDGAYWASIRVMEAKEQIKALYAVAIKNQANAQGDEFSRMYDDLMIS